MHAYPILSVPATAFPKTIMPHRDLVNLVRRQYDFAIDSASDEESRVLRRELDIAERMSRSLAIEYHPFYLPEDQIVRPRGLGTRNDEALAAIDALAPDAAKRALSNARMDVADVDGLLVTCSTAIAMPSVAARVARALGLAPTVDLVPLAGMGCVGGGHAIGRAFDYVMARPNRTILIVAADIASPWFYAEPRLRGVELRGSFVSASLFSDGVGAAVMSRRELTPGYRILATNSICVPDSEGAISWKVQDDGLHFSLTDQGVKSIPDILPAFERLLNEQGWTHSDLGPCCFHTGGNKIISDVQRGLGLTDFQVRPTWDSLRKGNTMSVAVFDGLEAIANDPALRPRHGTPGIGAGYGPGFAAATFAWRFHHPQ